MGKKKISMVQKQTEEKDVIIIDAIEVANDFIEELNDNGYEAVVIIEEPGEGCQSTGELSSVAMASFMTQAFMDDPWLAGTVIRAAIDLSKEKE
jgi:hypothetical protein